MTDAKKMKDFCISLLENLNEINAYTLEFDLCLIRNKIKEKIEFLNDEIGGENVFKNKARN